MSNIRINAKDFVSDVRSGLSDDELMQKYALPERALKLAFEKAVSSGVAQQTDIENRISLIGSILGRQIESPVSATSNITLDVLNHFQQYERPVSTDVETRRADETSKLIDACFVIKPGKLADIVSWCLDNEDFGGAIKSLELLKYKFPDSKRIRTLATNIDKKLEAKASATLAICWDAGGARKSESLLRYLASRCPDSHFVSLFAAQIDQKKMEIALETVEACIETHDLEGASRALEDFRHNYPEENEIADEYAQNILPELKSRGNYQDKLKRAKSQSLEDFFLKYPRIGLPGEIVKQIKIFDSLEDEMLHRYKGIASGVERLERLLPYLESLSGLTLLQVCRVWHLVGLEIMKDTGAKNFAIINPSGDLSDDLSCSVCDRMIGARFPVQACCDILGQLSAPLDELVINPLSFLDIDNMSREDREAKLLRSGQFLPPYCNYCRCQIVPWI